MIDVLALFVTVAVAGYIIHKWAVKKATARWKDKPTQEFIDAEEKRIGTELLEELLLNGDTAYLAREMIAGYIAGKTNPLTGKWITVATKPYVEKYSSDSLKQDIIDGYYPEKMPVIPLTQEEEEWAELSDIEFFERIDAIPEVDFKK